MPIVTGTLADFGFETLAPLQAQVVFRPSSVGTIGGRLLATRERIVTPNAAGYFEAELASTSAITPATWYDVSIRWLDDDDGGYPRVDHVEHRLFVPPLGGTISELFRVPNNNQLVPYFQPHEPDPWPLGSLWINSVTGDITRKV